MPANFFFLHSFFCDASLKKLLLGEKRRPSGAGASSMAVRSKRARHRLWVLLLLCWAPRVGLGYVVLTKEGYSVEQKLLAQAGARVAENLTVHGLTISTPSAQLRCNPSRKGALRWSDSSEDKKDGPRGGSFEACDGECDRAAASESIPRGTQARYLCQACSDDFP